MNSTIIKPDDQWHLVLQEESLYIPIELQRKHKEEPYTGKNTK